MQLTDPPMNGDVDYPKRDWKKEKWMVVDLFADYEYDIAVWSIRGYEINFT